MRNILIFIARYSAFLLFLLFEGIALAIFISNNSYQRSQTLSSSNELIGGLYEKYNTTTSYLLLSDINSELARENATLLNQLESVKKTSKFDTSSVRNYKTKQRYSYIAAEVINNSIHFQNNYITLNKGYRQGIKNGMGVICPTGVVGIIINTTENFSIVQSFLHEDSKVSAMIEKNGSFGSLVWGETIDSRKAMLKDIPSHVKIQLGDKVVTSGFSHFPAGIPIGTVSKFGIKGGGSFYDVEVTLFINFNALRYVYVVKDIKSIEQQKAENIVLKQDGEDANIRKGDKP